MSHDVHLKVIDLGSVFQVNSLIGWLLVGLIAGALASQFVRGRGFGCIGNIVVGLLGALIGGVLATALDMGSFHFCGSIFISFIGAVILLGVLQFFTGGARRP